MFIYKKTISSFLYIKMKNNNNIMNQVLKFNDFQRLKEGNDYAGEWPMNKQNVGLGADDVANDQQYAKKENVFQEVQEQMKIILKPIILKKNPNADDRDIEKIVESFFNLGAEKAGQVKQMVDGCKDAKKCAQDIVNQYLKYVKINFNTKDNVNDVEQDSVMTSENLRKIKKLNEFVEEKDKHYHPDGTWTGKADIEHEREKSKLLDILRKAVDSGEEKNIIDAIEQGASSDFAYRWVKDAGMTKLAQYIYNEYGADSNYFFDQNESVKKFGEVCEECDGKGYIPGKGKCKTCKGTGLSPRKKNMKNG